MRLLIPLFIAACAVSPFALAGKSEKKPKKGKESEAAPAAAPTPASESSVIVFASRKDNP